MIRPQVVSILAVAGLLAAACATGTHSSNYSERGAAYRGDTGTGTTVGVNAVGSGTTQGATMSQQSSMNNENNAESAPTSH